MLLKSTRDPPSPTGPQEPQEPQRGRLPAWAGIDYNGNQSMSMTIEITSDLEPLLMAEAHKAGVDPVTYTQDLLRKALPTSVPSAACITAEEASLLKEINQGISPEDMARYEELIRKRQQETISQQEFRELQESTRRLEDFQTRRMRSLAVLAKLRGVSMLDLMSQLEIRSLDVL